MLSYLFEYLNQINFPGAGVFKYISFRASLAMIISLFISIRFGKIFISYLKQKQVYEPSRIIQGNEIQDQTKPTMGGIILIIAILLPTILLADINNVYINLIILTTLWMGFIGFWDDYIKVYKNDKKGLKSKFKVLGQVGLGIIIGVSLFYHPDVNIRVDAPIEQSNTDLLENKQKTNIKSLKTNVPFFKNNELDYGAIFGMDEDGGNSILSMLFYVFVCVFIITAVSNGTNLTDGLDGMAAGCSAIITVVLAILAYISGNVITAEYLNVFYIPYSGELVIFIGGLVGACIGFLWYNTYPAKVIMGDTGSLTLGGIIATICIILRKELLIPLLCGIFFIESISVILQVYYFKYTKKWYGEGKRLFLMAPIHHHYQKRGIPENVIVVRFWISSLFFAVLALITLKLR